MDAQSLGDLALGANMAKTQYNLMKDTQRLSTGLRVNSAADDPSGLAIATSLASKVAGLDQGSMQIQDAGNALMVAEGAMQTISEMLQRMRSLVVQARSDLMSASDVADVQTEINQLILEINKVAAGTQFNGRNLLDGSASSAVPQGAQLIVETNSGLTGGGSLIDNTVDPAEPAVYPGSEAVQQLLTVDSYDPVNNVLNCTVTINSPDSSFGVEQVVPFQVAVGTNFYVGGFPPSPGSPTFVQIDQNNFGKPVLSFNIGTLNPGDVGASSVIVTLPQQTKAAGSAIEVNTGDGEGSIVSIDIGAMNAQNLAVNQVTVTAGDDLQNQASEYRIDYAIGFLANARATIGAQIATMQDAAANNNIASVNTQASESAIRDLNVGSATTTYMADEIKAQEQTRILQGENQFAKGLAHLVASSIIGPAGG